MATGRRATSALRRPVVLVSILVVATLLLISADDASASTFNPTGSACLDNEATVDPDPLNPGDPAECDGNTATGAASSITATFNLPSGDANFASVVTFTPPEWAIPPGNQIPDGAIVGQLISLATLGLINGACDNTLPVMFTLMDATTSTSPMVTFENGFIIANGLPLAVTMYPDFLNRIFPGQTPRARLYGQIVVAGVYVSLNLIVFEPGTPIGSLTPDPRLGFPAVAILANIGDPFAVPQPFPITDFCSPLLVNNMTFGITQDNPNTLTDEGGFAYRSNPQADGAHNFVIFAASQRDADDDGIENALDTCPFDPNVGDPRISGDGDADSDGLDAACDPDDFSTNSDQDFDGYLNRQDNCPQAPNGLSQDNQADADMDGIGDACDTIANGSQGPTVPDGHFHTVCLVDLVQVGAGGTPAIDPQTIQPCDPDAPVDSDSDGFSNADEDSIGTNPFLACGPDNWPPDINGDQIVDIFDVNLLAPPAFFSETGDPDYTARRDIDPDGIIDIFDVNLMAPPIFFATCTP